jgi:hypothetical protein
MATMVHLAKAHSGWPMVVAFGGPCHSVHGNSTARLHTAHGHHAERGQRTRRGTVLHGAVVT